jgi:hypothetical protein
MNKRSLMVMVLIGLLGFGMIFAGCENGTTPNDDNEKEEDVVERVVAEKYRGRWIQEDETDYWIYLEKPVYKDNNGAYTAAWTEGTDLYVGGKKRGYFENDTTLKFQKNEDTEEYSTYTKQP